MPPPPLPEGVRSRALLVQSASGKHRELLALTHPVHAAYAARHEMQFRSVEGPLQTERAPEWDKILLLREVLGEGEHAEVFWLDADALIVAPETDLRGALPAGAWLGMVQHGRPPYYNAGVMYLRNTPECRAFLEAVWEEAPVDHAWEDNQALIRVLKREPERWAQGICHLPDRWNSTYRVNESPEPVVSAWHGYGTVADRRAAMESCLREFHTGAGSGAAEVSTMEPDWTAAPDFGRREPLLRALRHLWRLRPGAPCIVETGTLRSTSGSHMTGDGWSTVAWGWYSAQTGGRVTTVDCNPDAIEVCRRATASYAEHLGYVCADSVAWLQTCGGELEQPIDLLYLDSFDWVDRPRSEAHNLAEAEAALPHLAEAALVLIDDMQPLHQTDASGFPVFEGKGHLTVPFLLERGFRLEWSEGGQVLLSRGAVVSGEAGGSANRDREVAAPSEVTPQKVPAAARAVQGTTARHQGTGAATFTFQGATYARFAHPYNNAAFNERAVEVPLARAALEAADGPVLEVGNVLAHYFSISHTVVDQFERAPGVLNVDIEEYEPEEPFALILSVSTLEFIGWQPGEAPEPGKVERVLTRLTGELLGPGGRLFATVPLGYNPHLDLLIREQRTGLEAAFLQRVNQEKDWEEITESEVGEPQYGHPFNNGNVVAILTYEAPL